MLLFVRIHSRGTISKCVVGHAWKETGEYTALKIKDSSHCYLLEAKTSIINVKSPQKADGLF